MKMDVGHALYTVAMILLVFVASLVVTKTIGKYTSREKEE
jgi:hypothetical protein